MLIADDDIATTITVNQSKPLSSAMKDTTDYGYGDTASAVTPAKSMNKKRVARRHSVDFAPRPTTATVVEFEKADDDCKKDIWYSRDEYDIIKARNSLIVRMMKTGNFEENEEHSFRGLEHKLKAGYRQRRDNKFNALNAVLEEQDTQQVGGNYSDDVIARKYARAASNAKENAFVLALKDAEHHDGPRKEDLVVAVDHEEISVVSDLDCTIASESTEQKKTKISRLFGNLSRKKDRVRRRASM